MVASEVGDINDRSSCRLNDISLCIYLKGGSICVCRSVSQEVVQNKTSFNNLDDILFLHLYSPVQQSPMLCQNSKSVFYDSSGPTESIIEYCLVLRQVFIFVLSREWSY